jgi:hypothetical protein
MSKHHQNGLQLFAAVVVESMLMPFCRQLWTVRVVLLKKRSEGGPARDSLAELTLTFVSTLSWLQSRCNVKCYTRLARVQTVCDMLQVQDFTLDIVCS